MKLPKAVLCCIALAGPLAAQNVSSSVTGTILDPSGTVVAGAECLLTRTTTGATSTATSWTDGSFTIPNVQAGTYSLQVRSPGFKTLTLSSIEVTSAETRALGRLSLTLGETREVVDVRAEVSPLQLSSSEKSGLINGQQLNNVAIRGRDFVAFLATVPGVVDRSQSRETTSPTSIQGISINGGRENAKNVSIDGITNLDVGANQTVHYQPNMDAIAEVKVLTSNYQAEYGRNAGGVITVITKSGTSQFHGSAYHFYRHETLNANNFFNNRSATQRQPYRYRISGYSLGGPIYVPGKFNTSKNRLFFFASQEFVGVRRDYGTRLVNVPSVLERQGDYSQSFDINGALIPVIDPQTRTSANPNGTAFAGNRIPAARINAAGQSILRFFPEPNFTDPEARNRYAWNFRSTYSGTYPRRNDVFRGDWNLSSSTQVYYRFIQDRDEQNAPFGTTANGAINFLLTPMRFGQPGQGHVLHLSKTFNPTTVLEVNAGRSSNQLYWNPEDPTLLSRSRMGNAPQLFPQGDPDTTLAPDVSFGGQPANTALFVINNMPYENWNNIFSISANLSKVWNRHTLKAGLYFERTSKFQVGAGNFRGAYNFTRDVNNPLDANNSFANALLGNFRSYTEATERVNGEYYFKNYEWYVQDNFRATSRLTLDLGLRVYHLPAVEDRNLTTATFDPSRFNRSQVPALYRPALDSTRRRVAQNPLNGALAPAPLIGLFVPGSGDPANGFVRSGTQGYPRALFTNPTTAFGPRAGFAWDVFGNGQTAVRGGFGLFFDRSGAAIQIHMNGQPPVAYIPTLWYGSMGGLGEGVATFGPTNVRVIQGEEKLPKTMNYSFGVQQRLFGMVADASYVGSLTRNLIGSMNINPIPMFARFDPASADPTQAGRPLADDFFRTYLGVADIAMREARYTSNYHAFQLSLNRRFSQGFQFGLSYTFSKVLGVTDNESALATPYFDPRRWNYGPLAFDRTQVAVVNYIYDIPSPGKALNWRPLHWALGNWQISGITSLVTGAPVTPGFSTVDGQDITGSSEGPRITVTGDPKLPASERTFFRNFRTEAFARTPLRSFGNAGIGILRGPGYVNWDLSITKRVPLWSEERFLQVRGEFFNAFNNTQFSGFDLSPRFDLAGRQVNPNFGAFTSARDARVVQISARFAF
ncbi:MAG: TonB-dependent receptor [Bryobacterales bacterium]|nr:TonB-dependent receptor [Bryobacterales bacterium]